MPAFSDGKHQYLDAAGILALHDAGQIVGAHTCNHPTLTLLNFIAMNAELSDCKHQIENIIGVPVRYFAYPNGAVNQTVLAATAQAGYRAAFTTRASGTLSPNQPLLLPRIRYDVSEAAATVVGRITSAR
jgi:peptidoglycan/xylan/chitin deacetylase (PgdA/CDA1 family)